MDAPAADRLRGDPTQRAVRYWLVTLAELLGILVVLYGLYVLLWSHVP